MILSYAPCDSPTAILKLHTNKKINMRSDHPLTPTLSPGFEELGGTEGLTTGVATSATQESESAGHGSAKAGANRTSPANPEAADASPAPAPAPPLDAARPEANAAQAADNGGASAPVHMPINVRSVALGVLTALAVIFMLRWAGPVLVPLILGLTLAYALSPAVDRLAVWRVPRAIGAGLVMALLVGTLFFTVDRLRDDATELVESLPQAAQKVRETLRRDRRGSDTPLDKVQEAAVQLQKATQEGAPPSPLPERGVTRVQIETKTFDVKETLWSNMPRLLTGLGEATLVVLMAYFLLASGDSFRRKLVKIAGPSLARRKITVQGLDEVSHQIQRYLMVQVVVSVIVGVSTWLLYMAIGLEHPAVWGVAAFALNFIPYLGSIAVVLASTFVAFVQFGSWDMALLLLASATTLQMITGYILTPWLTARASRLSALSVFVAVIAFGWLWGFWGLLLGVPTLMMIKAVCDRVDGLQPIGELLGR